jgi:hypothetical protein
MKVSPRGADRSPLEYLQVQAKMKRGLMSWEWVSVQVLKFDAAGMTIRTDEDLSLGGRSLFSIRLAMEFGEILVSKIEAVALSREKVCSCFDYLMMFDFSNCSSANREGTTKNLKRIDSLLASYSSLVNRMKSGPISAS